MALYLEMLFTSSEANVIYHTGVGVMCKTEAGTRALFDAAGGLGLSDCNDPAGEFLLDLKDGDTDDVIDTVILDRAGFETITGEAARDIEHYARIDAEYWERAVRMHRRACEVSA